MSRGEIVEKLDRFVQLHEPISEECQVVYLMVEIRKILDHDGDPTAYRLLRFYSDWTVHTSKDRITSEMKMIIQTIYDEAVDRIQKKLMPNPLPSTEFLYMENLKTEMDDFFTSKGLYMGLFQDSNWVEFVTLLVAVLVNQPINKPIPEVKYFVFAPAKPRCVHGILAFTDKITGYDHYKVLNAY